MRILFLGTPEFAVPSLRALAEAGHEIALVVTRPDKPRGRGQHVEATPVKLAAQELSLPVEQPASVNNAEFIQHLRGAQPHLGVVVGFGQILSAEFLSVPAHGYVNVHASLLPKYRGAAPIQRALLNDETETGVTVQFVAEKLDSGDLISWDRIPIEPEDTLGSLEEKLAPVGTRLLVRAIAEIERGKAPRIPQDESQATYAPSVKPEEARIDWVQPARRIVNQVRAFKPRPIAFTYFRSLRLNIFRARVEEVDSREEAGVIQSIDKDGPLVQTGTGRVRLLEVQQADRKRMSGFDWANGMRIQFGERFE